MNLWKRYIILNMESVTADYKRHIRIHGYHEEHQSIELNSDFQVIWIHGNDT